MIQRLLIIVAFICAISCQKDKKESVVAFTGSAFGTTYSIQYFPGAFSKKVSKKAVDSIIEVINYSMSTYQDNSYISKINKGDTVVVDAHFIQVLDASREVYRQTDGVFDPTIGNLVNAWDFGPESQIVAIDSAMVDSMLVSVGLDKIVLNDHKVYKSHQGTFLDFNALAKGYAVDVVADYFTDLNYQHFLVEIGGEIRSKGKNKTKDQPWKIGVEDPNFDGTRSYSKVIPLTDEAMATSGSYRKFKVDDKGNRFAHIIDAKTGHPLRSNLLSVSVITPTCMLADAYATAFMAMGLEKSKAFLSQHKEIKAFFVYAVSDELETLSLNGFPDSK
ncbi:FAD:protein FMN transferase [Aquimarina sp. ERC-38]|uniref:FAD:protein FMN transferase n=1 Tax=Aquimarina sp. ERC-38 TaxID=2949996 RepID=UPI0022451622|nr:FAD:protein FMN transferase [Aquimarina sp. ERC-38]UZO82573.1 FAD:protein FMN transferase [Aquimarina sp. ERC-38]